jgi:transcription elongation factor Elf1
MPKTYDGQHCPKCGDVVVVTESIQTTDATTAFQEVKCTRCDTRYHECYTMTVLAEVDKDGTEIDHYDPR